jgi:hypothetical protein
MRHAERAVPLSQRPLGSNTIERFIAEGQPLGAIGAAGRSDEKIGRPGCPRNDDLEGGQALVSPDRRRDPLMRCRENRAVEMPTLWKSQNDSHKGLGKLAQNASFPHFHKPVLFVMMTGHFTSDNNRTCSRTTNKVLPMSPD